MYFVDRTAAVLKPTSKFLQWLNDSDDNMPDLTIEQFRTNCSVYLIPDFEQPEAAISYFDGHYDGHYLEIFEA